MVTPKHTANIIIETISTEKLMMFDKRIKLFYDTHAEVEVIGYQQTYLPTLGNGINTNILTHSITLKGIRASVTYE